MNKYLVLGDGLLATEIVKQTGWSYISRKKDNFDFTNLNSYCHLIYNYETIINCIAYTKTYDNNKEKHWNTNYKAVVDLVDWCEIRKHKLCHISTDYLYTFSKEDASEEDVPVHCRTFYGYTKLLADAYVQLKLKNYLLIRTSFKPRPFPYEKAIMTQVGNFDYTDTVSNIIIKLIEKNKTGIYNVGTSRKRIYDLAIQTKPDIIASYEYLDPNMPENITMNLDKLKKALDE